MTLDFELKLLQLLKDMSENIARLTDSVKQLTEQIEKSEQQPQS